MLGKQKYLFYENYTTVLVAGYFRATENDPFKSSS